MEQEILHCPFCDAEMRWFEVCECENNIEDDDEAWGHCNVCERWVAHYEMNDWGECPTCQKEDRHAN